MLDKWQAGDGATLERQIDAMQPEQVCEGLWIRVVLIKERKKAFFHGGQIDVGM